MRTLMMLAQNVCIQVLGLRDEASVISVVSTTTRGYSVDPNMCCCAAAVAAASAAGALCLPACTTRSIQFNSARVLL